jgi:hypothetical protein
VWYLSRANTIQEVLVSPAKRILPIRDVCSWPGCIVMDGWPLRRAAERFQVSVLHTAVRWSQGVSGIR